jgi:hypothetical protein
VHWGSYNNLLADNAATPEQHYINQHILGQDSPKKRLMIKSTGQGYCGASTIQLFPETKSAIVVLSNGLNCGDAADFTASILVQELFDLQPRINILSMVAKECQNQLQQYDIFMQEWEKHRDVSKPSAPIASYEGSYRRLGLTLLVRESTTPGRLELCFNDRMDIVQPLEYYNVDKYSYMPKTRDQWLKEAWIDWDFYTVGVLDFKRNPNGQVEGLYWKYDEFEDAVLFKKETEIG